MMTNREQLETALDLLVARASLDARLRKELVTNPRNHCLENGIQLPKSTQIIFTSADTRVIIKEIPVVFADSQSIQPTADISRELVSNVFNTGETTTETVTQSTTHTQAESVNEVQVTVGPTEMTTSTLTSAATIVLT